MSVSSTKLREPSILLAASNCQKMIRNIGHLLDESALSALEQEITRNVVQLFQLGDHHFRFAKSIDDKHWRQKISRFYYAAYNIRRALDLKHSGHFATDVGDHKRIGEFPDDFPGSNRFATELKGLRDDRNLADYDHEATEDDLLKIPQDVERLVSAFRTEVHKYLTNRGATL